MHSLLHRLHNRHLALLLIRIAFGVVFVAHGMSKLNNMEGTTAFFASLGLAAFWATLIPWLEVVGGILLIVGFLVRYVGILLAVEMVFAIYLAHLGKGYSLMTGGYEYALLLGLGALALFFSGAGHYSLAHMLKHRACHECEVGRP
jgi:putative oxidoreductase